MGFRRLLAEGETGLGFRWLFLRSGTNATHFTVRDVWGHFIRGRRDMDLTVNRRLTLGFCQFCVLKSKSVVYSFFTFGQ